MGSLATERADYDFYASIFTRADVLTRFSRRFALSAVLTLALFAGNTARAADKPNCDKLAGTSIEPSVISLPTKGGSVTSSKSVAPSGDGKIPSHCLVSGEIKPVDPKAGTIMFQLALPDVWNGKAVMLGGGGFNGVVRDVAGDTYNASPTAPSPLARGYAVFTSDSGHQIPQDGNPMTIRPTDGEFFTNGETYRNYIGDALKKTHDAAIKLIKDAYGAAPAKSYFLGGSKGGGEAITVAGRWPADWDGIMALYPARNFTASMLGSLAVTQALSRPGAYLDIPHRSALYRAALQACDALDGAEDKLISNVRQCRKVFDPAVAKLDGKPLRCANGAAGDNCLSDKQIAAIRKVESPVRFGFTLKGGQKSFPGYNLMTSDLGASTQSPLEPALMMLTIGAAQTVNPPNALNSLGSKFSDNFMRYAVTGDISYNQLTFDFQKPGKLAKRLTELSAVDVGDEDLSAFAARGGKLIIMHGTDDMLVNLRATQAYVRQLQARMGKNKVDGFLRYFEIPGFGHALSTVFGATYDQLGALENWVEKGRDPAIGAVVMDVTGVAGRTRPACLYPKWPKYDGSGNINSASSFTCALK